MQTNYITDIAILTFEMYKKERTQGPHNQEQKVGDTQRILKGAAAGGTWRM